MGSSLAATKWFVSVVLLALCIVPHTRADVWFTDDGTILLVGAPTTIDVETPSPSTTTSTRSQLAAEPWWPRSNAPAPQQLAQENECAECVTTPPHEEEPYQAPPAPVGEVPAPTPTYEWKLLSIGQFMLLITLFLVSAFAPQHVPVIRAFAREHFARRRNIAHQTLTFISATHALPSLIEDAARHRPVLFASTNPYQARGARMQPYRIACDEEERIHLFELTALQKHGDTFLAQEKHALIVVDCLDRLQTQFGMESLALVLQHWRAQLGPKQTILLAAERDAWGNTNEYELLQLADVHR
jgi:hypothetical protein